MRVTPERVLRLEFARQRIITPASPEFSSAGLVAMTITTGVTSSTWASANDPVALPFRLSRGGTVLQLGWVNGTAAGGNIDIGIYDESWARLVSAGSTVGSGNSIWQFVNVTDTPLLPTRTYYLAMVMDNITANRARIWSIGGVASAVALVGGQDSATDAFPLPNPLTNMAAATVFTVLPVMGIVFKDPF